MPARLWLSQRGLPQSRSHYLSDHQQQTRPGTLSHRPSWLSKRCQARLRRSDGSAREAASVILPKLLPARLGSHRATAVVDWLIIQPTCPKFEAGQELAADGAPSGSLAVSQLGCAVVFGQLAGAGPQHGDRCSEN